MTASGPRMPAVPEFERAILGACFLDGVPALEAALHAGLAAPDLYEHRHQTIYRVLIALSGAGKPLDQLLVKARLQELDQLDEVGPEYLMALTDGLPRGVNVPHYAAEVIRTAGVRRLVCSLQNTLTAATSGNGDLAKVLAEHRELVLRHSEGKAKNTFHPPPHWQLKDVADVSRWDCPALEPIIEGIAARGNLILVAAESQTGKTLVGLHIARKMVTGGMLFGKFNVTPVEKVLYLALEDPARRMKDRVLDDAPPDFFPGKFLMQFAPGLNIGDEAHFLWLRDLVISQKPDVLFLDTYQKATPGIASYDDVKQSVVLHHLADLTRELDLTLWIHDHFRKSMNGKKRSELNLDDIKGTGGKAQNADCYLLMDRAGSRLRVCGKSKDFDQPIGFLLDIAPKDRTDGDKFVYAGDVQELATGAKAKGRENLEKVFAAVADDWQDTDRIVAKVPDIHKTTATAHLRKLRDSERIESRKAGKRLEYRLATDLGADNVSARQGNLL